MADPNKIANCLKQITKISLQKKVTSADQDKLYYLSLVALGEALELCAE